MLSLPAVVRNETTKELGGCSSSPGQAEKDLHVAKRSHWRVGTAPVPADTATAKRKRRAPGRKAIIDV
jgi:hypothetical protein